MNIKLKEYLNIDRKYRDNTMTLYSDDKHSEEDIENINRLKKLVDGEFDPVEILKVYDVEFTNAKEEAKNLGLNYGIIRTTIPCDTLKCKDQNIYDFHYRNYEIAYKNDETMSELVDEDSMELESSANKNVNMNHLYSYSELKELVDSDKVILLNMIPNKPSISYRWGLIMEDNEANKNLVPLSEFEFRCYNLNSESNKKAVNEILKKEITKDRMILDSKKLASRTLNKLYTLKKWAIVANENYKKQSNLEKKVINMTDSHIKKIKEL